jgi:hypothetical protein
MKTMMMITILVLMTTIMAKSEEQTYTVSETIETVKQIPSNVSNWAQSEWTDIKEYQKASWEQGKEQNAANWAKIKSFFTNLTGQGDASQN